MDSNTISEGITLMDPYIQREITVHGYFPLLPKILTYVHWKDMAQFCKLAMLCTAKCNYFLFIVFRCIKKLDKSLNPLSTTIRLLNQTPIY